MRRFQTFLGFSPLSALWRLFHRDPVSVWQARADRIGRDCDRLKRRMQLAVAAEERDRHRAGTITGMVLFLRTARLPSLQRKATS